MPGNAVLRVVTELNHLLRHTSLAKLDRPFPRLSLWLRLTDLLGGAHTLVASAFGFRFARLALVTVCAPIVLAAVVQWNRVSPHERLRHPFGRRRVQRGLVTVNIEQLRRRALFWLAHGYLFARQQATDFAMRIIHVAGDDGVFGTNDHAGRFQADVGAVSAIVALGCRVGFRIDVDGVVRASLHAGFAADTDAAVEFDNTVGALVHGLCGADARAGRVGAMVAARDLKVTAGVWISPGFNRLYPRAVDAQGYLVLAFASGRTGVATDTFAVVDHKTVICLGRLGVLSDGSVGGVNHGTFA